MEHTPATTPPPAHLPGLAHDEDVLSPYEPAEPGAPARRCAPDPGWVDDFEVTDPGMEASGVWVHTDPKLDLTPMMERAHARPVSPFSPLARTEEGGARTMRALRASRQPVVAEEPPPAKVGFFARIFARR